VGGIKEILPVAEIMQRHVAETEAALSRAMDFRLDRRGGARCTGTPTGHFCGPRSGSTIVFAVEQCGAARDPSAVARLIW
jgi:hypothetical protein